MRATKLGILVLALTVLGPSLAHAALGLEPCRTLPGFVCGSLAVPLDRSGAQPGTVRLQVAAERPAKSDKGILIALSGGPGQAAVSSAPGFQAVLSPLLRNRRLVVVDQRGTGGSGALNCPALQRGGGLDSVFASIVAACADRIGTRRTRFATADTVEDLDAIRAAFGAAKTGLMGISYGTFVATQYARIHPDRVDQLVLDSVVGDDGIDAFLLDSHRRVARLIGDQCRGTRCRRATADPKGDLAAVAAAASAGTLTGRVPGPDGEPRTQTVRGGSELFLMLIAGDLNPFLQPALPAALAAARAGDLAPLLRLRRVGDGGEESFRDISGGLNVTTLCNDTALPYALTTPLDSRPGLITAALDAIAPEDYAPFDKATVLANSIADDCRRWPAGDEPTRPSTAPLPDVPTLILDGRLDLRTPLENAEELAAQIPSAQTVIVPGLGHDTVDSDLTGCVDLALRRFAAGRRVGRPCAGRSNQVAPFPRPPLTTPRTRAGTVAAVRSTIDDALVSATQALYAGLRNLRGGGLRAGRWTADFDAGEVSLRGYVFVPGVRVTGTARSDRSGRTTGRFVIDGPGRLDGVLRLSRDGRLRGTVGRDVVNAASYARTATLSTALRGRFPTFPLARSK